MKLILNENIEHLGHIGRGASSNRKPGRHLGPVTALIHCSGQVARSRDQQIVSARFQAGDDVVRPPGRVGIGLVMEQRTQRDPPAIVNHEVQAVGGLCSQVNPVRTVHGNVNHRSHRRAAGRPGETNLDFGRIQARVGEPDNRFK